jgi:hypothetical protein
VSTTLLETELNGIPFSSVNALGLVAYRRLEVARTKPHHSTGRPTDETGWMVSVGTRYA